MLVLIVPVVIVFMQMDERFSRRPLSTGAATLISLRLAEGVDPLEAHVTLTVGDGLVQDSRPVRVSETREVAWRVRVADPGTHRVTIETRGNTYTFPVVAGERYRMIGHERSASSWIEPLVHPAMPSIPPASPIARVAVAYPAAAYPLLFWDTHWIAVFIVYSFLAALVLKFVIKFEI
jgi:hypothetical protein